MIKLKIFQQPMLLGVSLIVPAVMALTSTPVKALTDVECALDKACSLSRGGVSDLVNVYLNGVLNQRFIIFGNDEGQPFVVPGVGDPSIPINYPGTPFTLTVLTEQGTGTGSNAIVSDVFGIIHNDENSASLFAWSDLEDNFGTVGDLLNVGFTGPIFEEKPLGNPYGYFLEPGSSVFTIEYDLTQYLHPNLVAAGYKVTYQSDAVPEPFTILGVGTALGFGTLFKSKLKKKAE
ncbi:PEP-CTERM sorting domain-containing protein [Gloeothece verrucosa]|uniref:PEP-CTERM protein-sorting domain-containing protein n=1 Tax=Gloeothece verrucosa (strain PCC 7822) TaxID=497965 RepID=E0UJJ7_GLOV7|nr:PEP-CTERM sorting domain-containing protein [Gloeothece verrucosa]ADN12241.1 hypothetical protein Cyan7822_0191 [Gloeothece verrucosa PCC 7822]